MFRPTRRTLHAVLALVVLWTAAATTQATPPADPSVDARQRLELPAPLRDKVLLEMRLMLEAVHGILNGVVAGDPDAVAAASRGAGMAMAADVDPEIKTRLPEEFLQLGMGTHQAFDRLADNLEAGGTVEAALADLAAVTGNCVACHATFRLDD